MPGSRSLSIIKVVFFLLLLTGAPMGGEGKEIKDVPLSKLEEVTDLIMSPGCNYIYTLTNCPSVEAVELRKLVKSKLAKGETKEEIINYLVKLYGPRVLASPQKKGFFLLAWWVPYLAVIDGAIVIALIILVWRRRTRKEEVKVSEDLIHDKEYEERIEKELKDLDL